MNSHREVSSLVLPVLLLYTAGLLMIFDASSGEMVDIASGKSFFGGFFRQLLWGVLGIVGAYGARKIGWRKFIQFSPWVFWSLVGALVLVLIPGIGISANGSRRWLGFHGMSFQPSEFMKVVLPAYYIFLCASSQEMFQKPASFLVFLGRVGLPVLLILLEPNNGTAAVIVALLGAMTILVGIPTRFWVLPLCVIAVGLGTFAFSSQYVRVRINNYLHPEADIRGKGHQPYQAKIAAGSGGLFGRGPAKSVQKLSYLPEAQNDYIAAIFAEEYGFVGIFLLILVYLWLFHEIWRSLQKDLPAEGFCLGMAILFLLVLQSFTNLAVVSGLLPSTGLNLPFFSQGGSSLIANSVGVGLVVSMQYPESVAVEAKK
jgi:cell division protein FtsW